MQARGDGDNEGAHLQFYTTSAAAGDMFNGANVERMRVTSEGSTFFYHGGTNHVTVSGLAYCNGVGAGPSPASVCLAVGRDSGSNRSIHCQGHIRIADGYGIQFESSSTSAVLDDYEEGTFTPNYDAGGGVTFAYSQQYGFYTKIGDTVFFTIYLQGYASSITGGNENNGVALQGLPFTIKNHARYDPAYTIGRTYKWDIDSDKRMYSYGVPNTTTARFIIESDDSTGSIAVASQLNANTTEMFLNGHYKVSG